MRFGPVRDQQIVAKYLIVRAVEIPKIQSEASVISMSPMLVSYEQRTSVWVVGILSFAIGSCPAAAEPVIVDSIWPNER